MDMYVRRNADGEIDLVSSLPYEDENGATSESLPDNSAEIIAFFAKGQTDTLDRVTARQFKLQLLAAGLLDQVDAWIGTQDRATQIAYEYSGSFLRSEPMMQAGFEAMGFTAEQVDAFFLAASKL